MSSDEETSSAAPGARRKSGRQGKIVERLINKDLPQKGENKYIDSDSDDEKDTGKDSDAEIPAESSEEDEEEAFEEEAPKKRKSTGGKGKGRASAAVKPKANGTKPKAAPKKRKPKKAAGDEDGDVVTKGDYIVADDNELFNAVKNPNASLESVVDDWIESYKNDAGPAMAQLVNFAFRASGCNSSIDEHQAEDENGVVDTLDDINAEFKDATLLAYPLVSKSKALKKFRTSLQSFLTRLFVAAAASEILYDTSFCQVFQSWLTSLSSSKIRSFRHTATVFSLSAVSALCQVAVGVNKEFASASRALEAEQKKGRKDKSRLKDLEKTVGEVHERKTKLEEYMTDLFEAVFVHRYRDSEQLIRGECIKALGEWMKIHPEYWLEGNYLRYIGWVLSDDHKDVRHESVKALLSLYPKEANISSMLHFTERFKAQLVRMATSEIDLAVRISCLLVLQSINRHNLLEDDQTDEIAKLIFEEEKRVRVAVAAFFGGILDEAVKERETVLEAGRDGSSPELGGKDEEAMDRLRLKCLAELLVKYGRETDGGAESDNDEEMDAEREGLAKKLATNSLDVVRTHRGRIALAIDALWDFVGIIRNWQAMIDLLVKDHSVEGQEDGEATPKSKKGKGKKVKKSSAVEDPEFEEACQLTEEEETLLVEVLVASLGRVTVSTATSKKDKDKDEEMLSDMTRAVIDGLPRLFAKHQTVPARIVDILAIPRLIKLDLYLDMRMVSAYEALWDDVTKQLLKHTDVDVTDQAIKTIGFLLESTVLGNTNDAKIVSLEDTLISSLRTTVAGKDIEVSAFEEDELSTLSALVARIFKLFTIRDISNALDDNEGEKQTSAWEIIDSLVERGRLGYKEEGAMIEHAMGVLYLHLSWRIRRAAAVEEDGPEESELESIVEARSTLLGKLEDLCVGANSNAVEGVKQAALAHLLDIYLISAGATSRKHDPNARLSILKLGLSDEVQARAAGFVEAEIERYSEAIAEIEDAAAEVEEGSDTEMSSGDDAAKKKCKKTNASKKKAKKIVTSAAVANARKLSRLLTDEHFERTISPFVRAIHSEVIDIRHASVILAHCDQFGAVFEQWAKLLAQDLKDEAIYGNGAMMVAKIIFEAYRDASDRYLTSTRTTEESMISLSKVLASATYVRGAQLSIIKQIPREEHAKIHIDIATYVVGKITAYEEKEKKGKAIFLFKPLVNLLIGLDGHAALKIKTALDSSLEDLTTSAKIWEPLRAYQKRLVTIASKDPAIKSAAAAKAKKSAKIIDDEESENEGIVDPEASTPKTTKRKSKSVLASKPRAKKLNAEQARVRAEEERSSVEPLDDDGEVAEVIPPRRKRPSASTTYGSSTKKRRVERSEEVESDHELVAEVPEQEEEEEIEAVEDGSEGEVEELLLSQRSQTGSSPLKRAEVVEEEEPAVEEEQEEDPMEEDEQPQASQNSTMSVSEFRKKRSKR